MTQLDSTTSTCGAQWKMWLIKVFSIIYVSAVCAAQDPQNVTTAADVAITAAVPIPKAAPTVFNPPVPFMQRLSLWPEIFLSEKAIFSCDIIDSSDWTITWKRDYDDLSKTEEHLSFSRNGSVLTITAASEYQSGNYSCAGEHKVKKVFTEDSNLLKLTVDENKPKPTVTPSFTSEMFTGESVTFTCAVSVSSGWEYTWFHNGKEIQASDTYTITSVDRANSGQYHCKAKRGSPPVDTAESDNVRLDVSEIPVPSLTNLTSWLDVFTDESVRLGCGMEAGSSDWTYTWYKDGHMVQAGNTVSVDPDGAVLSIGSASASHAGRYQCTGTRKDRTVTSSKSTELTLKVFERPSASIILLTGWSEVFSTDSLVLKCVVESHDQWNHTWFKEDVEISPPFSERHSVTPQNDPDQSLYICQGVRNGRPTYSKRSDSFKTNNLLLKRRVLLSISGCLFFGLVAVFIGCIVLRVTRKPDEDLEKPEEANLFLTMAELKERGDAPCPLVEYITDADMKDLSKEPEENGTVCSESTLLPTVNEAGPSENNDTTENNGGMVSFKQ